MSNTLAQTAVAMERVQAILATRALVAERPGAREPGVLKGAIRFEHVAFAYDPATSVLRDVNFNIAPGQLVGVVGATGGGKSTIVSLIPRFYDPNVGRVLIDGVDVREFKLEELRNRMPKRYDSLVGERGLTLSGGQRQRIGIARAIIRDAPIRHS
jgi:subfamily B ATP-binding cassette protein MsbA